MRKGESGQATALVLLALGAGMLVIVPFLGHLSTGLIAGRNYHAVIVDRYSSDAGIEWGLWRVKLNPDITSSTTYTSTPLQPFPGTVNGAAFPITEIRNVSAAGSTETLTPPWQAGTDWKSYPFTTTAACTVTVTVTGPPGPVRFRFLDNQVNDNSPPFTTTYNVPSAGSWVMEVRTPNYSGQGTITLVLTYSGRVYDIRSTTANCVTTVRCEVVDGAVTVKSWLVE